MTTSFDWAQPIRTSEAFADELTEVHMTSGINNGFINIYRDEHEDFCGNSVFETEEEAIEAGKAVLGVFGNKTILFETVQVKAIPY